MELAEHGWAYEKDMHNQYGLCCTVRWQRNSSLSNLWHQTLTLLQIVGPLLYTTDEKPYYHRGLIAK